MWQTGQLMDTCTILVSAYMLKMKGQATWRKTAMKGMKGKPTYSMATSEVTEEKGDSKEPNVTPQKKTTRLQDVAAHNA